MSNDSKPLYSNIHPKKNNTFLEKIKFILYRLGIIKIKFNQDNLEKIKI